MNSIAVIKFENNSKCLFGYSVCSSLKQFRKLCSRLFTLVELNLCTLQKALCSKLKTVVGIKLNYVRESALLIGL